MRTLKLLICCLMCTALLSKAQTKTMADTIVRDDRPLMGVFVCSSYPKSNNTDSEHREVVIQNAYKTIGNILGDNYKIVNLNEIIPYDQACSDKLLFSIDHKAIGRYAQANHCKRFFVIHYEEQDDKHVLLIPGGGIIGAAMVGAAIGLAESAPSKAKKEPDIHNACQVFGWVYDSSNNHLLIRNHPILRHFENYESPANVKETGIDKYLGFLSQLTLEMYQGIK